MAASASKATSERATAATHVKMSGEGDGPGLPYSGGCRTALSGGGSDHKASHSSFVLRSSSSLESYSAAEPPTPSPMPPLRRRRALERPSTRINSRSSAFINSTNVGSLYCFDATGLRRLVREDRDDSRRGEESDREEDEEEERRCREGEAGWRIESEEAGRRMVKLGSNGGESGVTGRPGEPGRGDDAIALR